MGGPYSSAPGPSSDRPAGRRRARHSCGVGASERTERLRAWVAVGLWIALIFALSGGDFASRNTEGWIRAFLFAWIPGLTDAHVDLANVVARKGMHVFEYGVLALLARHALRAGPRPSPPGRAVALALALVAAVATADEIHQSRTPGRTGTPRHVGLDLAGAAGALLGLAAVRRIRADRSAREAPAADRRARGEEPTGG